LQFDFSGAAAAKSAREKEKEGGGWLKRAELHSMSDRAIKKGKNDS